MDLKTIVDGLDKLLGEADGILKNESKKEEAAIAELKVKAKAIADSNEQFRQYLIEASRRIAAYEEYYNALMPVWGSVDNARKQLAVGAGGEAAKFLDDAQSRWNRDFADVDQTDFADREAKMLTTLKDDVEATFPRARAAATGNAVNADDLIRQIRNDIDSLLDVHDDALDIILQDLNRL